MRTPTSHQDNEYMHIDHHVDDRKYNFGWLGITYDRYRKE